MTNVYLTAWHQNVIVNHIAHLFKFLKCQLLHMMSIIFFVLNFKPQTVRLEVRLEARLFIVPIISDPRKEFYDHIQCWVVQYHHFKIEHCHFHIFNVEIKRSAWFGAACSFNVFLQLKLNLFCSIETPVSFPLTVCRSLQSVAFTCADFELKKRYQAHIINHFSVAWHVH